MPSMLGGFAGTFLETALERPFRASLAPRLESLKVIAFDKFLVNSNFCDVLLNP